MQQAIEGHRRLVDKRGEPVAQVHSAFRPRPVIIWSAATPEPGDEDAWLTEQGKGNGDA